VRVIKQVGDFRIIEKQDIDYSFDDLCGDSFNHKVNPEIPKERLDKELREFQRLVDREGVYGYVLEKWNPEIGQGWEHVDSCWGFVGQYSETDLTFKHYIVEEMLETIAKNKGDAA
jgi:hypothetical protein